jgi:hypothetical protein
MGQRSRTLAQIFGFDGFRVSSYFETAAGARIADTVSPSLLRGATLVLVAERRWQARCCDCGRRCGKVHERLTQVSPFSSPFFVRE